MSLVWSAVVSTGFHCTLSSDVITGHLSTKQHWHDLCRGWFELIRGRCRCFRFGGYDRWKNWLLEDTTLDVSMLEFMKISHQWFLEAAIVGGYDFGGYESWTIQAWRFWIFAHLCFWGFQSLDAPILEVMNLGRYELGGYENTFFVVLEVSIVGRFNFGVCELWSLWSWRLWTYPIPPIFGGYDRWMIQFWRLWTLEVMLLEFLICHHFGCFLEVMNVGCCGFGCCVNWMLRSWMLQYSPGPKTICAIARSRRGASTGLFREALRPSGADRQGGGGRTKPTPLTVRVMRNALTGRGLSRYKHVFMGIASN